MAKKNEIIVVKIGSSVIAPKGKLDKALIPGLVRDILSVEKKGYKVVIVSSGAIACGLNQLKLKKRPKDTHTLMAISSLGQIILMDIFNANFKKYKRDCAQVLLTWDDFDDRKRYMNIKKTIERLINLGAVPIINENDVVSNEEIGIGDNDRLSAFLADLVCAKQLIILSDIEGLLDGDELVREVGKIDKKIKDLVKKQDKIHTRGGMDTKLQAVTKANLSGISVRIADGRRSKVIPKIVEGKDIGTLFLPSREVEGSRKRWIDNKIAKGAVYIDDGAKEALLNKGKSLLGVGITEVRSQFDKGDAVVVLDKSGTVLGKGIINYSFKDFQNAKSKRFDREVIHRDNFVKTLQGWVYHPCDKF